mmetsp:Transcript_11251/g.37009  ORF Transcript_11251/g.37009 Transcript_11251/m.37009 type:complete len:235 (-) Transcript_11251:413-1117(-)
MSAATAPRSMSLPLRCSCLDILSTVSTAMSCTSSSPLFLRRSSSGDTPCAWMMAAAPSGRAERAWMAVVTSLASSASVAANLRASPTSGSSARCRSRSRCVSSETGLVGGSGLEAAAAAAVAGSEWPPSRLATSWDGRARLQMQRATRRPASAPPRAARVPKGSTASAAAIVCRFEGFLARLASAAAPSVATAPSSVGARTSSSSAGTAPARTKARSSSAFWNERFATAPAACS